MITLSFILTIGLVGFALWLVFELIIGVIKIAFWPVKFVLGLVCGILGLLLLSPLAVLLVIPALVFLAIWAICKAFA